jgi:hypothetical protein
MVYRYSGPSVRCFGTHFEQVGFEPRQASTALKPAFHLEF